jgi:hypothetical protein
MESLANAILVAIMALPLVLIGGALVDFFHMRDENRRLR